MTQRDEAFFDEADRFAAERAWWRWPAALALLLVLLGAVWFPVVLWPQPPGDDSADAGFARDMARHHEQAVAMASTVYLRTRDPLIRTIAYDILTTQQGQIGIFTGWLDQWGLPWTGSEPAMAWMGHPTNGSMPGMATKAEVESLATLPPDQMDITFLQLMIRHHQGGVLMADAGTALAKNDPVRTLARGIAAAQRAEIAQMQNLLAERGLPPVIDLAASDPSVAEITGMDMGASGTGMAMDREGFVGDIGTVLRRSLRYLPLTLGLASLGWLLTDVSTWFRPVTETGSPSPWRWLAVGALGASAALHAGLAPEHFDERTSFGLFFAGSTIVAAFLAGAILAWPARLPYLAGAAVAGILIVVWALFRVVPPPGADEKEAVDLIGLVTKATETVALAACTALWLRRNTDEVVYPSPALATES